MSKKYTVKPSLKKSGFPTSSPHYQAAHRIADKAEKAKYPQGYEQMKKVDARLPKGELAGKNLKNGKIEVSEKVPAKFRAEVALHERTESINIARMEHHEKSKKR